MAIYDSPDLEVVDVSGVRVVDTSPRAITVNLENQLTNKVPVTTRAVGQLPIGYELGPMTPQTGTRAPVFSSGSTACSTLPPTFSK